MSRPTDEELAAIVAARWPNLEQSEAQIVAGDLGEPMATSGFRDLAATDCVLIRAQVDDGDTDRIGDVLMEALLAHPDVVDPAVSGSLRDGTLSIEWTVVPLPVDGPLVEGE